MLPWTKIRKITLQSSRYRIEPQKQLRRKGLSEQSTVQIRPGAWFRFPASNWTQNWLVNLSARHTCDGEVGVGAVAVAPRDDAGSLVAVAGL